MANQTCCDGMCCTETCMFSKYCLHTLGMSERTTLIVGGVVLAVLVVVIVACIVCCCTSSSCCRCCHSSSRARPDDSEDDAPPAPRGAAGVPLTEVTTDPAPAPAPVLTTSISSAALRADDAARMDLVNCLELARGAVVVVLQKLHEEMLGPPDAAMLLAAATSGSVLKFKNASPAAFVCLALFFWLVALASHMTATTGPGARQEGHRDVHHQHHAEGKGVAADSDAGALPHDIQRQGLQLPSFLS